LGQHPWMRGGGGTSSIPPRGLHRGVPPAKKKIKPSVPRKGDTTRVGGQTPGDQKRTNIRRTLSQGKKALSHYITKRGQRPQEGKQTSKEINGCWGTQRGKKHPTKRGGQTKQKQSWSPLPRFQKQKKRQLHAPTQKKEGTRKLWYAAPSNRKTHHSHIVGRKKKNRKETQNGQGAPHQNQHAPPKTTTVTTHTVKYNQVARRRKGRRDERKKRRPKTPQGGVRAPGQGYEKDKHGAKKQRGQKKPSFSGTGSHGKTRKANLEKH